MESWISGEIRKGDLILAILHNYSDVGIYLGNGRNTSHQYYGISSLCNWIDNLHHNPKHKPPYKSYVSNCNKYRMVKYSSELMNEKTKEEYNKAIEALKLLKI